MLSWLAQPECHRLRRIRVDMSTKQVSCSSEPNRLVIIVIACKAVLWSPSTVQHLRAMIQHPVAWLNQIFLLTLPVSEVFISFRRTNDSLRRCLGLQVKYFIVLTGRRKKKQAPCAHTDSSKSKGSHVLVVFYCWCDMKSFSVAFCEMPFYVTHLQCSILCLPAVFDYNVTSKTLLFI